MESITSGTLALISLLLLFSVIVIHLHFVFLPAFFFVLGIASYAWNGRKALMLFLFLLPLASATPDLFFNGYPFNYMAIPLFYLSGILVAALLKKEKPVLEFPGHGIYLLFLGFIALSVFFVFWRWFNLGLSPLAFLKNTPVAPSGERLSFACIFPVITMALFSLSPFLFFLLRHWRLKENEIFFPLQAGFCLSFVLALVQKWLDPDFLAQSWWGLKMNQVNGGFSDFNAFGFFAGVMFLYQALRLIEKLPQRPESTAKETTAAASGTKNVLGYRPFLAAVIFLGVALAAVYISGCRTAFLFVLAAAIRFFFSRKTGFLSKAAIVLLLGVSLLVGGGTLRKRLQLTIAQTSRLSTAADRFRAADKISNGRLTMFRDSLRMTGRFPGCGVGAGNFLFYLKYLRGHEKFYEDLPLNQYLLIASETGLPGILAFLFFLAALLRRQKPGATRFILSVMACALLFNNFFWFPEALLLFWIFVARGELAAMPAGKKRGAWGAAAILCFIAFNIGASRSLHPRIWAQGKVVSYDYGFSYLENDNGRQFRWIGAKAGMYVYSDRGGKVYRLFCGAPLPSLPNQRQVVDVYWRGKLYRTFVFRSNREFRLRLEGAGEGFLEFRVRPAFNLKRLGLGDESRDLGVQVSGPGI